MTPQWIKIENIFLDGGRRIENWKFREIKIPERNTEMRLYYNPFSMMEKIGFEFYAVDCCVWNDNHEPEEWDSIFHGNAHFDGIKHLYFGDPQTDNEGNFYSPSISDLILICQELKKLEQEFCRESY